LDDGQLTDSYGRRVDFKNCVLIMTSNVGARKIKSSTVLGFGSKDDKSSTEDRIRQKLMEEVRKTFNPEFLGRVDEILVFHPLGLEEIAQIVDILMGQSMSRLKEQNLEVVLSEEAKQFLIEVGFDPAAGARPMRRTIQRHVEDPLSDAMLRGEFAPGDRILINRKSGKTELSFEKASPPKRRTTRAAKSKTVPTKS
jgi:ATP-dependent Clp protease ATP-binding subunit ClpC